MSCGNCSGCGCSDQNSSEDILDYSNRVGIESQIFTNDHSDVEGDMDSLSFFNITLLTPVGDHPVGSTFPMAVFDHAHACLGLLINDQDVWEYYELNLTVGSKLK